MTARMPAPRLQNQFDSVDLSDNAIVRLEGFPKLHRLRSLHLNSNRINRIGRHLEGERAEPSCSPCRLQGGRLHGHQAQLPTGAAGSRSTALLAVPPAETIPSLEWLILTNNKLANLSVRIAASVQPAARHA